MITIDYMKAGRVIIENIGGQANVIGCEHCSTRLRFILKDNSKVNMAALNELDCVLGVVMNAQCQIIIGNEIFELYDEICNQDNAIVVSNDKNKIRSCTQERDKNSVGRITETTIRDVLSTDNNVIVSPATGEVIALEQVNDEVFRTGVLGDGIAIVPATGAIYAPVSGVVETVFHSSHAIGICGKNGAEVLLHVGINTVELEGKYFYPQVKEGDSIEAGQLLLKFDPEAIHAAGYETTTLVIVTNSINYKLAYRNVKKVQIGTPIMTIH